MVKRCIYCRKGIEDSSVVDMCSSCMYQVWGEKMAKAIVSNMEKERDAGNLELGNVGDSQNNLVDSLEEDEVEEIDRLASPEENFGREGNEQADIGENFSTERFI